MVIGMKRKLNQLITEVVSRIVMISTLVYVYAAIIIGIITPMLMMVPLHFISWKMFKFFTPRAINEMWMVLKWSTNTPGVIILIIFEFILFTIGLVLFVWGLTYIAKTILKKEGLAKGGPYKFIRHPQHMGIILMSFTVSLFVPWTTDLGIRVGEVLSWSLFSLVLILWSYYEEWKLAKRFGEKYFQYRSETGAFLPKIFTRNKKLWYTQEIRHWRRLLFTFVGYICFILLLYFLAYILFRAGIMSQLY